MRSLRLLLIFRGAVRGGSVLGGAVASEQTTATKLFIINVARAINYNRCCDSEKFKMI